MKNIVIIHGMPDENEPAGEGQASKHWIPWLRKELKTRNIKTYAPEMPEPRRPTYESWKKTFEPYLFDEETVHIGHSAGAGFLIRYFTENKIITDRLILVAPWLDIDQQLETKMFDFHIDPTLTERTKGITIFYSTDDDAEIIATANMLHEKMPNATVQVFSGLGHFTEGDMGRREFPELLDEILRNESSI